MAHSVKDIAAALGAQAFGAVDLLIEGASEPATAAATDLALAMTPAYGDALKLGAAQAAVVWPGADWQGLGLKAAIIAPRARLAMAGLTQMLDPPLPADGISAHAAIDASARLGRDVRVGAFAVIGAGALIGDGTWIGDHVSIMAGVTIGADCQIHAGVRLQRGVHLGAGVILQPNVVIGGDGFSFVTAESSNVERARETLGEGTLSVPADPRWHRIHSLGGVVIGDNVQVGANSSIDAGTIRATQIGAGTKIDSLVQVGHNVIVGQHCLLCAQAERFLRPQSAFSIRGARIIVGYAPMQSPISERVNANPIKPTPRLRISAGADVVAGLGQSRDVRVVGTVEHERCGVVARRIGPDKHHPAALRRAIGRI